MNRIKDTFKKLKKEGKKAFIPYIIAGDPNMRTTEKIITVLEKKGADIIELGIPFSDPIADGPTIQRAIQRSLNAGCTVKKVFDMVKRIRKNVNTPLVFMTYYNIIFNYGTGRFVKDMKAAGADGIIVPDLPMEESGELTRAADREDICVIMLAAPTTPLKRFKKIARLSNGFIYYVSLTGVTGVRKNLSLQLNRDVGKLRKVTSKPVCVGFGVSTPDQVRDVVRSSDGVIVGSAIISKIEKNLNNKNALVSAVGRFAGSMAKAVHGS